MSEALLDVRGLTKRFGGVVALKSIDLTQSRGETLGMIGPNGSGKTTFVNCITGQLRPNAGTVLFNGRVVTARKPYELAQFGLTRTFQAVRVLGGLSVGDNIEIAMVDAPDPVSPQRYAELADWLKIAHRMEATAGGLSLDEQRRLELMMRLVQQPQLIMLDEPVGGLSSSEVRAMIALLAELKQQCTVFVIEHTMKVIRELADKVVVLLAGEKLAEGPPAEILADQRVIDRYLGAADA
jgi:ABC-type branched-subunit amino acid transport system ATPase component